jgi:hypothetical protein
MSFLTGRPGILVADHLSGYVERVRQDVAAILSAWFAGRKT